LISSSLHSSRRRVKSAFLSFTTTALSHPLRALATFYLRGRMRAWEREREMRKWMGRVLGLEKGRVLGWEKGRYWL
jgi:hypothetical protein